MEELTHYIFFSDAQKRYGIKQAALSYRIKSLGLKTKRIGRNTLLTLKHISLLDDLDLFLKDNSGKTINRFLTLRNSKIQSIIDDFTTSDLLKNDESIIKQYISGESLMSSELSDIKSQIMHILKAVSRLDGTMSVTNQSLINNLHHQKNVDKDREITELKKQINEQNMQLKVANLNVEIWYETIINSVNLSKLSTQELNNKKQDCDDWKNFFSELIPLDSIHNILSKIDGRVYLKTNYFDYDYAKIVLGSGISRFYR